LTIIEAPKPSRNLIELLLLHPLRAAATVFATSAAGALAVKAVDLLLKLIGAG